MEQAMNGISLRLQQQQMQQQQRPERQRQPRDRQSQQQQQQEKAQKQQRQDRLLTAKRAFRRLFTDVLGDEEEEKTEFFSWIDFQVAAWKVGGSLLSVPMRVEKW